VAIERGATREIFFVKKETVLLKINDGVLSRNKVTPKIVICEPKG